MVIIMAFCDEVYWPQMEHVSGVWLNELFVGGWNRGGCAGWRRCSRWLDNGKAISLVLLQLTSSKLRAFVNCFIYLFWK